MKVLFEGITTALRADAALVTLLGEDATRIVMAFGGQVEDASAGAVVFFLVSDAPDESQLTDFYRVQFDCVAPTAGLACDLRDRLKAVLPFPNAGVSVTGFRVFDIVRDGSDATAPTGAPGRRVKISDDYLFHLGTN